MAQSGQNTHFHNGRESDSDSDSDSFPVRPAPEDVSILNRDFMARARRRGGGDEDIDGRHKSRKGWRCSYLDEDGFFVDPLGVEPGEPDEHAPKELSELLVRETRQRQAITGYEIMVKKLDRQLAITRQSEAVLQKRNKALEGEIEDLKLKLKMKSGPPEGSGMKDGSSIDSTHACNSNNLHQVIVTTQVPPRRETIPGTINGQRPVLSTLRSILQRKNELRAPATYVKDGRVTKPTSGSNASSANHKFPIRNPMLSMARLPEDPSHSHIARSRKVSGEARASDLRKSNLRFSKRMITCDSEDEADQDKDDIKD
ncbi:hypothetical protein BU24DRAFT_414350 [Aaosphaeria arxii CBS 175.79]|uniref:Uncharacterized protein n=1 Tax=Aaosphaeria arxii CBS 175.79 TaxID=1450172 RepID=A0A6A5XAM0_9PLEO|nr:uncharacterized protein BU24DRAFT_414350 [Aaosphaeria arxii CBS 175.79]KAF2009896.1 hypothetical protein BU24DRAFT_414350 [Aaosphaeria arxii CBS 175.79]